MGTILLVGLGVLFLVNLPIAFALGASSTLAMLIQGNVPLMIIPQRMFASVDSFPLMAIPFFVLAGNLMGDGGISRRLIDFVSSIMGRVTGGLAIVTVATCMFFAAISGSSAATAAAIGTLLIPAMVQRKYELNFAAATVAASGELGVIIPPSIPMVLYGVMASQSIGTIFLAGFIPGILIAGSLMLTAYVIAKKKGFVGTEKSSIKEIGASFKEALLALLMPVIILGGIYGGIFTPTEAAVVAVFYGGFVGLFIYREIKITDLKKIFLESTLTTSTIMIIIANASTFGWIMTREQIPIKIAEVFMSASGGNPLLFLFHVNILLLLIGTMFETSASIIILTPLLLPVALQLGIDPIHFGMIIIVNLAVGMVTPPLGINLFVTCNIAKTSIEDLTRYLFPYLLVLIADIFIITYIPQISLWLPRVLGALK
ncbi:TRAP transporter large permease [Desulfosporosinus sp. BICA1-9]|uniref:TRAP transporter large permease n=1 Tax=Desulfosporosinus sp. BICA1-9 TaxID=1531958 RepID=UPI00054BB0AE|nr:TRAP transporter large permease [Desulfosporosinus sp. BICA1-9]KJS50756.1 MAG: C4-dicarboxylate ABC transporter permease [Peptococcaceae bacterium BRH_c23]KJS90360.1 MAG: C4-dicarboxylate ABC transporter permease [Desulfosporosinus sp. BICA1-9]HBW38370.1 TRAP transporter large permease [Desulfosporosinus sp.]